ncbi:MAG: 30S ribosomal protein S6 [Candidatus Omnitrophica bacterium CG1_02_46_14]|nr:MAG: 30S ribosomal protein S6 [Candidatus Omnitrophica bacterium CG1_02_46_14]
MRNYEGTFIINADLSTEITKGVVTQIQELITKNGGRVDRIQEWGKKRLAYKINKRQEGNYVIMNFQMESSQSKKLDQGLKLNDNLMRFLLVNKDAL